MNQVALIGNPNTGKTSLFNVLTGSYENAGNWAGVTVEKKVGTLKESKGSLVDLPGIYSLNPVSKDESIATSFLLHEESDGFINIVDAAQLQRNLHLTVQLLEYGKPVLVALNMIDVAKRKGLFVDIEKLSSFLQCPVVPTMARTGKGCEEILHYLASFETGQAPLYIDYGSFIESAIVQLIDLLPDIDSPKRWIALQILEGNQEIRHIFKTSIDWDRINRICEETQRLLTEQANSPKNLQQAVYLKRNHWIQSVVSSCLTEDTSVKKLWTDRIDTIVTHRVLGIPIFLFTIFLMFKLTFDWIGNPIHDWMDFLINDVIAVGIQRGLTSLHVAGFLQAVILDGIIPGVGGVLVFVPQIFILFTLISFIEDSGYMARIAMVMDRLMELVGLNGKSFIPMIIGFGCNVPGIMAARTVEQPRERLLTILLTPLMSCSARLTVYSLFVGTFFVANQALVVWSLYVLGIVIALILAYLFAPRLSDQNHSMFVVELPPYRFPQLKTIFRSTWEKVRGFIVKAGTFIFGGSVIIWLLSFSGPGGFDIKIQDSFLAWIGKGVAYFFEPLGFGSWQAGAALLAGFLAKEIVVSTMNIIYTVSSTAALQTVLSHSFTPLQVYSFMAYLLLYVPCLATVAVIKKETMSTKWTLFSVIYPLVVAYLVSFIIYQGGKLLGFT